MTNFDYDAPAEVYSAVSQGSRVGPVTYRRFDRSADAIRFTIEQLPAQSQPGTAMEVNDERFGFAQIRDLYHSEQYPLARPS